MMEDKENRTDCDTIRLIQFLGKKWTFPILRLIKEKGKVSFNDISNIYLREINPRSLSQTLQTLLEFRIIERINKNNRILYKMSENGKHLDAWLKAITTYIKMNDLRIPDSCKQTCFECKFLSKK